MQVLFYYQGNFYGASILMCLNLCYFFISTFGVKSCDCLLSGGSVGVISYVQKERNSVVETAAPEDAEEMPEMAVKIKGSQEENSLDLKQSSQADWIRRYMELQEEVFLLLAHVIICYGDLFVKPYTGSVL